MEVYLDNSATTKPYDEVVKEVADVMSNCYGNPSSLHLLGKNAEDKLTASREIIAKTLSCKPQEIFFTSGGTESDNLAIIGYAMANKRSGMHLVTQKTEHMAVLEAFKYLETQGFSVTYADVDENGIVDADELLTLVKDDTILVSIMHVNNETGAIMPIEKIASALKGKSVALHVDAVQSYGKLPINVKDFGADMISISAHKIHGPNGVGALYIKSGTKINPVVFGGKQESAMRSGTENLAGICGFAKAAEIKFGNMTDSAEKIARLKKMLCDKIKDSIENVVINSPENSVYSILNVAFPGLKSEVLLHILESNGIYVSTGSACNSKKKLNYVLKAMNLKENVIDASVRFSLGEFNTEEDIEFCVDVLKREVPVLRKIMR